MSYDADMFVVIVTLKDSYGGKLPDALAQLRSAGLTVDDIVEDEGVVQGTIGRDGLAALSKLDCVQYVRRESEYLADFPAGDPRDRNGGIDEHPDPDIHAPDAKHMGKRYP